jgi:hypothetical protein
MIDMSTNEGPKAENLTESNVSSVLSPFCSELRSKRFFMMDGLATEASHYIDGSNHCWCFVTQQVIGPDGSKVVPDRCVPGRECYKSALE